MASTLSPPQVRGRATCHSRARCDVALALFRLGHIHDVLDHSATCGPHDKLGVDTAILNVSAKRKPRP